jgi:hypothetical protein
VVAEQVEAVVVSEPKNNNKEEEPGLARLRVPVPLGGGRPDLATVELWSRCVPEGFVFRVGDVLSLDVQVRVCVCAWGLTSVRSLSRPSI